MGPHENHHAAQDLLADIRAVSKSITMGGVDAFSRNLQLGVAAFERSPLHAVVFVGMIAARRLAQVEEAYRAAGREPVPFPRVRLLDAVHAGGTSKAACVDFLERLVHQPVPEGAPAEALIKSHGVVGFMVLVQIANETGRMLAEADPSIMSLDHLLELEALADERDATDMISERSRREDEP